MGTGYQATKDDDLVTQGNDSLTRILTPGEGVGIQVERTDVGTTDDTFVGIIFSLDDTVYDADPSWRRRVKFAQFPFSLPFRAPFKFFRVRIENASAGGDTIICRVSTLKDGIDL